MTDTIKQPQPVQDVKTEAPKKAEGALDDKQLDSVTGGKASAVLAQSCATGVHFKPATITH